MVVGLVGCGSWGRHILRDLLALGCEVPVVARSEASRARADEGGAAVIVSEAAALPRVDGVVVATPTSTHAEVLERVLELDVPVYCEKPLCDDAAAAARLTDLAANRLFVMDKWRYHPGVLELAELARGESLGAVQGLRTLRLGWGNPHDDVDAVWVLAPHDLAIALEILGEVPSPREAVGVWRGEGEEQLAGLLSTARGWHALEVSGRSPERIRRVELHCEDGIAVLAGGWDEHVSVFRPGGVSDEERISTPGELPLLAELRAFVEHLGGGPPPKSSAAEGAAIVAAIVELRRLAAA